MNIFLGIDSGSVSTKVICLSQSAELTDWVYLPTAGDPLNTLRLALRQLQSRLPESTRVLGVAVTGSARELVAETVGADMLKNEISSQAKAAAHLIPEVKTVIEIGGQDSKLILLENGFVVDFAMNTICAAGTGSFLEHQSRRLDLSLEDMGQLAQFSQNPIELKGRCTVFVESDMIHFQQTGSSRPDIVYGLCKALARNYLNDLGLHKEIRQPVVFQGGVARNPAMKKAFEEELGFSLIVPPRPEITGAWGVALLLRQDTNINTTAKPTNFRGFDTPFLREKV
ncbi:acyl-CoA dehydratase activase [Dehalococcoides mccartyi]|jgi:predicted CoA-substrate-specific enzyme activase|uniref:BadF/BadG/BcrA/BcrD ATPase n=1 Tax=Dehalococcoides mccartyi TaxID=61435 RepID=A0A142V9N1_9CHLR|nr:acyl-CoA dehydratase activase [Dehalococcoides mccartyi]AII60645.1 ATPase [Dehalococcoides mccartyi CG5]AMU86311.1 BadF/BadG/BcrA/BcrD ATPase [Dehalococcoides mccartyi]MBA2084922.1 Activator of 2-hydroxyglutaryl-CoA dehydratase [Dehalococcoides mccartyi]OBW63150.1 MAG: ATPase [Dehalococcoides mccartyi]QBX63656.1 ATPase [Dehalococcoides mccartyi]